MAISIRPQGDVRILEFKEGFAEGFSLDLRGSRLTDLSQTVKGLLDQGCRQFVLDLGPVTFLDSAALGELIACHKRTLREGGDIRLLHPTGKLRERLEMLHLTRLFGIFDDESEALASFGVKDATDA